MKLENALPLIGGAALLYLIFSPKDKTATSTAITPPAPPSGTQGLGALGDYLDDLLAKGEDAAAIALAKAIELAMKDPDTQQILSNVAGDAAGKVSGSIVLALVLSTLVTIWAVKRRSA